MIITANDPTENGYVGTKTATFTINKGRTEAEVVSVEDAVYTPAGAKGAVTVIDKETHEAMTDLTNAKNWNKAKAVITYDGKKLGSKDYKLTVKDTALPEDGVVTVTIEGQGNYEGSFDATYRVITADKNLSKARILKKITKDYTGDVVTLTDAELTGLLDKTYGTDYKVASYSKNVKKGTAKVTLQGIGTYGGTKVATFKIAQKKGSWNTAGKTFVDGEWTNK